MCSSDLLFANFGQGFHTNDARSVLAGTINGVQPTLIARATGADPFELPESWIKAKSRLNLATPFDVVSTNDIIGGNSGSPLVNRKGEVIGLVFDGNIESLGGDYGYDGTVNRTVSVDSSALLEAMDKVYGAGRLVKEITGSPTAPVLAR